MSVDCTVMHMILQSSSSSESNSSSPSNSMRMASDMAEHPQCGAIEEAFNSAGAMDALARMMRMHLDAADLDPTMDLELLNGTIEIIASWAVFLPISRPQLAGVMMKMILRCLILADTRVESTPSEDHAELLRNTLTAAAVCLGRQCGVLQLQSHHFDQKKPNQ